MSYQTHVLPNGIKIIHKKFASTVAHCGLIINAGSRDEKKEEHGLAHFIEHALFKMLEEK
jgi:predicted Zn-dependent peptidase